MKPKIRPALLLSVFPPRHIHSSERALSPSLICFCLLGGDNRGERVFIPHSVLWLKWVLLALNVGTTHSEQHNSPLCLILDLDQPLLNQEGERMNRTNLCAFCGCVAVHLLLLHLFFVQLRSVVAGFLFSSIFSTLTLPYLFGFVPTINQSAATPSALNSKNYVSIPFTYKFSHLSMDSIHLVSTQIQSHRIGLTESPASTVCC